MNGEIECLAFERPIAELEAKINALQNASNGTDLNISEVVYSIGFTSRSYFCKIFRQKYGCSPREYKKRPSLLQ